MRTQRVFNDFDIITDLPKKDFRLITGFNKGCYEYIHLVEQSFKDVFNQTYTIRKGDKGSQPADIVNKYFCVYHLR